jgi:DNA-binding winged helix-turn-helix (wHTH) protein
VPSQSEWFCTLLDTAPDVYFRFSLTPPRGFAYISPSVRALTGRPVADFHADRNLCLSMVVASDRPLLRRLLRAHRSTTTTIRLLRDGVAIPVEVRTVALTRRGRLIAIEGMARLAVSGQSGRSVVGKLDSDAAEPVQQRLAALMVEVHDLLHRVLPPAERVTVKDLQKVLRLGELALDTDRLVVTESGQPVTLTPREVQVLKHLMERTGRVVTRQHLLSEVWSYQYTGDDRTVDVHISRLRTKLPSLKGRLIAIRNIGYRLDADLDARIANC